MTNGQACASTSLYTEVFGAGDPILCLHGLGASIFCWRHFIVPFSRNNKLILVDFKGCGKSPKPRDKHYSIEENTDEIYKLILAENLRNLTLVGNSLGGAVALLLAIRLNEQEPRRLSRLVLIDSAGDKRYLPVHLKLIRTILGPAIIYLAPSKLAAKLVLRMCYFDKQKITCEQVEAYAAPMASLGGRHALLQTAKQCIPPNVNELLTKVKTITVPTFILWGREDTVIPPKVGELLHQVIPNSTLKLIQQCGHIPQEEKPDETIALISNFLLETA